MSVTTMSLPPDDSGSFQMGEQVGEHLAKYEGQKRVMEFGLVLAGVFLTLNSYDRAFDVMLGDALCAQRMLS